MTEWRAPGKDGDMIIAIPISIIYTIQKSASSGKLFFSLLFMIVLGYMGQMRAAPKLMSPIFSIYLGNVSLGFQFYLIASTFQEGQYKNHLLD